MFNLLTLTFIVLITFSYHSVIFSINTSSEEQLFSLNKESVIYSVLRMSVKLPSVNQ